MGALSQLAKLIVCFCVVEDPEDVLAGSFSLLLQSSSSPTPVAVRVRCTPRVYHLIQQSPRRLGTLALKE